MAEVHVGEGFFDVTIGGLHLGVAMLFAVSICLAVPLYFLPTIIAKRRSHPYVGPIFILNFIGFLGALPWLLALMWSVSPIQTLQIEIETLREDETRSVKRDLGQLVGPASGTLNGVSWRRDSNGLIEAEVDGKLRYFDDLEQLNRFTV